MDLLFMSTVKEREREGENSTIIYTDVSGFELLLNSLIILWPIFYS